MLKIREEHVSSLAAQQVSGFIERMVLHLREVFPAEVERLDDAKLQALIARICGQGEEWGITKEPLVERLIELFVSFEELRRNPLPEWIAKTVSNPGRCRARALLMLENGLQFQEGRMSVASGQKAVGSTFYSRLDQAFYNEVKQENGGSLPTDLNDTAGRGRPLTVSPMDRAYRKKWKTITAQMRKSRATSNKNVKSACMPWLARVSTIFPPAQLSSKDGALMTVKVLPPSSGLLPTRLEETE